MKKHKFRVWFKNKMAHHYEKSENNKMEKHKFRVWVKNKMAHHNDMGF
jgi:hypothetical protein